MRSGATQRNSVSINKIKHEKPKTTKSIFLQVLRQEILATKNLSLEVRSSQGLRKCGLSKVHETLSRLVLAPVSVVQSPVLLSPVRAQQGSPVSFLGKMLILLLYLFSFSFTVVARVNPVSGRRCYVVISE